MGKKEKNDVPQNPTPKVHPDLEGFNIDINSFGEINATHSIEQLREFLDKHVVDKKLKDRDDLDVKRE